MNAAKAPYWLVDLLPDKSGYIAVPAGWEIQQVIEVRGGPVVTVLLKGSPAETRAAAKRLAAVA